MQVRLLQRSHNEKLRGTQNDRLQKWLAFQPPAKAIASILARQLRASVVCFGIT
jgi:hypothetical protein